MSTLAELVRNANKTHIRTFFVAELWKIWFEYSRFVTNENQPFSKNKKGSPLRNYGDDYVCADIVPVKYSKNQFFLRKIHSF